MVRSVPVLVSEALLNQLYDALGVWEKLESGHSVEAPGPEPLTPATTGWCAGGVTTPRCGRPRSSGAPSWR